MDQFDAFLQDSPLARRTTLSARLVLRRGHLTPRQLLALRERGEYRLDRPVAWAELEVGGQVLAEGEIIEREGKRYFRAIERNGSMPEESDE
jgi:hypothetical protein